LGISLRLAAKRYFTKADYQTKASQATEFLVAEWVAVLEQHLPIDESCQLRLPVSFDPATGEAKMLHFDQWAPMKWSGSRSIERDTSPKRQRVGVFQRRIFGHRDKTATAW